MNDLFQLFFDRSDITTADFVLALLFINEYKIIVYIPERFTYVVISEAYFTSIMADLTLGCFVFPSIAEKAVCICSMAKFKKILDVPSKNSSIELKSSNRCKLLFGNDRMAVNILDYVSPKWNICDETKKALIRSWVRDNIHVRCIITNDHINKSFRDLGFLMTRLVHQNAVNRKFQKIKY